ncbi:hypothetical protein B0H17DRAFT_1045764 [Mycena rosella]|uniref:Secreted protein n=1 Tax=Mycena rosella TaxID=1033263 RepID=A0AAD7DXV7_MYCRO|nr:hypothetical protein B0H17DRAFT_1045764 [Mycena rosella]
MWWIWMRWMWIWGRGLCASGRRRPSWLLGGGRDLPLAALHLHAPLPEEPWRISALPWPCHPSPSPSAQASWSARQRRSVNASASGASAERGSSGRGGCQEDCCVCAGRIFRHDRGNAPVAGQGAWCGFPERREAEGRGVLPGRVWARP